ncbi:prepilin-type N-terminal cleavage/methylation domain-containing protein [Patescibacteria group bacterium]|nr:prepilin-type N-terminal cleavage/methylation domain-containing protein [Patescibacteria group bacterium]MBU1722137.1 prepilin-type N-terminal cleavage/methylation domain-containing protein [Patescibacteria group bacterium]MBU1901186.1 prepilin-type N-terminal cleavage/methylation domain-containing protein [Patescibacteria group bacterium]
MVFIINKRGFTLIEMMIVIFILAIVVFVAFVALKPEQRFAESRNAERWSHAEAIATAVKLYTIDEGGGFPQIDGSLRMIGTAANGCSVVCNASAIATINIDEQKPWLFDTTKFAEAVKGFFQIDVAYAAPFSGWVSPTGFQDPGNKWINEARAYDGDWGLYASDESLIVGWGEYIVLTLDQPTISDRLRILADYTDADIAEVDVDVFRDGVWVDVFQGGDEATWNVDWVEIGYAKGSVEQVRFRWNYKVANFIYWLYELEVYQTANEIVAPVCGQVQTTYVGESSAILHGAVADDGGEPVEYRFLYGETNQYGGSTAWTGNQSTGDTMQELVNNLNGNTDYHYTMEIRNSTSTVRCGDQTLRTATQGAAWVIPQSSSGNGWETQLNGYDANLVSYTRWYRPIGGAQWSDFIYFNHAPVNYDKLRFYALNNAEVAHVDVDIFVDGNWIDAYQGDFDDRSWVEVVFAEQVVTQSRIRFSTAHNAGFFFRLYDYQIWQTEQSEESFVTEAACIDIVADLANYVPIMPIDPKEGTDERTYYAIKREHNHRKITVMACGAELGQLIRVTK